MWRAAQELPVTLVTHSRPFFALQRTCLMRRATVAISSSFVGIFSSFITPA
jgi:hypothetical protein